MKIKCSYCGKELTKKNYQVGKVEAYCGWGCFYQCTLEERPDTSLSSMATNTNNIRLDGKEEVK